MKNLIFYMLLTSFIFAHYNKIEIDLITKKDGNEFKGKIIEHNLEEGLVMIELLGGSGTIIFKLEEIDSITKTTISKEQGVQDAFNWGNKVGKAKCWCGFILLLMLGVINIG